MSIPSASKPILWWCAVVTVILLFCFFMYRTGAAMYHNHQLRKEFSAATNASPYQQAVPMEQMDFAAYMSYFPDIFTLPDYPLTSRIETPVSLKYYAEIPRSGEAAALEIAKGTTIIAIPEQTTGSPFYEVGYGYTSYPSYEQGWRYVRPFRLAEDSDLESNQNYYYVDINSLEAVLDKVIKVNPPVRAEIRQQGWSLSKGKRFIARSVDHALYRHGAYLSPDLYYRVMDRWNAILLGAIGMMLAAILLSRGAWLPSNR
ncbi:hypothetical protein [Paenibacillus sp. 1001270B_150601_E10]|uniref:hypothetical protein n=1 Tax=Paenibacillus sp. 1001270B_150601_E10 TaxID=2787079 RepID=UPI0018A05741|nr:hypothetical protein [Paenibacillus sp. 1001270B_150601_E10]